MFLCGNGNGHNLAQTKNNIKRPYNIYKTYACENKRSSKLLYMFLYINVIIT